MNTILKKISKLNESPRKDLLADSVVKAKVYLKNGKQEELKRLIKKLNGFYDAMTPQEGQICIELVNKITEAFAES